MECRPPHFPSSYSAASALRRKALVLHEFKSFATVLRIADIVKVNVRHVRLHDTPNGPTQMGDQSIASNFRSGGVQKGGIVQILVQ
mmetsp:Transcript_19302/g.27831  ORF Transcript_19302/g.27831 Transcript_19302/m.27831 type:complete len:86 (-) Transcript_19302:731-988(-)